MVLGGKVLERCLGHECGTLMKGINAHKRDPTALPSPFPSWGDTAVYGLEEGPYKNLTTLAFGSDFWPIQL